MKPGGILDLFVEAASLPELFTAWRPPAGTKTPCRGAEPSGALPRVPPSAGFSEQLAMAPAPPAVMKTPSAERNPAERSASSAFGGSFSDQKFLIWPLFRWRQ